MGELLKRRKEIYEAKHPESLNFSTEKQKQRALREPSESISHGFATDTATKTGLTARTIQQEVQIASISRINVPVGDFLHQPEGHRRAGPL